jgi:hypothetical protein
MPLRHQQRGAALALRLGGEQIGQPLRLIEIDAPVLERAAGELARHRLAQAQLRARGTECGQRGQHRAYHRLPAVAVPLRHILAGNGARAGKHQHQRLIEQVSRQGIAQFAQMRGARAQLFRTIHE